MQWQLRQRRRGRGPVAAIVAGAVLSQVAAVALTAPASAATVPPLPRAYQVDSRAEVADVVDGWGLLALSADGRTAVHLAPRDGALPALVATTLSTGEQEIVGLDLDNEVVPQVVDAAVSADGRMVAFLAAGANAAELHLPADADPYLQSAIFVRDRLTRATTWVRTPDLGVAASVHRLQGLALSADGRRLTTTMSLPLPQYDDVTEPKGVLVATLAAGAPPQTRVIGPEDLVAPGENPAAVQPGIRGVALSGDGTVVAVNAERNGDPVLLRFDATTGARLPGDRALTGRQASAWRPHLDHTGRKTALGGSAAVTVVDLAAGPGADVILAPLTTAPFVSGDLNMSSIEVPTEALLSADGSTVEFVWAGAVWTQPTQLGRPAVLASPGLDGRIADPTGTEVLVYPDAVVAPTLSADAAVLAFLSASTAFVAPRTVEPQPSHLYRSVPADLPGPTWPDGAALTTEAGTTTIAVSWPAASAAAAAYEVTVDGEVAASVAAPATQVVLSELNPGATVQVAVVARDANGRASAPLTATVTLLTDLPPGDAPLAALAGPGARVRLQWDASTVTGLTGYRVLRDGTPLIDLAPELTAYDDTAVAADTAYEYAVVVLRGDEQVPLTRTATVRTPALTVTEAVAHLPRIGPTPYVSVGRDVTFAIVGAPGFTGTAELTVRAANEAAAPVHISLTEETAGRYTGAWTVAEGTVELLAATLRLVDGTGNGPEYPVAGLPAPVGGLVRAHVDAPAGDAAGVRVQVWSDSAASAGLRQLTGDADVEIPVLPADDHVLTSVRPDGRAATEPRTLAVGSGEIVSVDVAPSLPATITVTAVDSGGGALAGARVTVTGAGMARAAVTDPNGRALITGLDAGTTVTVATDLPASFLIARGLVDQPSAEVTLQGGDNPVPLAATALSTVALTGVVRAEDGSPAQAEVFVVQDLHGASVSVRARTGADGTWTAQAYAGLATPTRVQAKGLTGAYVETAVTVGPTAPPAVELVLPKVSGFVVTPTVRVKMLDAEETELSLDPRNVAHFGAWLRWPGGEAYAAERALVNAPVGTPLQLCLDGVESGLPAVCTEAVLGPDPVVPMTVTLTEQTRVTAHIVDAAGAPVSGAVSIQVKDLAGVRQRWTTMDGPDVSISLPAAGTYVLVVGSGSTQTSRVVQAAAGHITALGTLALTSSPIVDGSRTGFTAVTSSVLPGGLAQLRADIHYQHAGVAGTARMTLPAGVTVPEDGVLLDGEPVPFTIETGTANVLVVDLPTTQGRTLQVYARAPGKAGTQLPFALHVTAGEASELVGTATVLCGYVSLTAGTVSPSGRVPLSGRAPAGAAVVVHEQGVEVARAQAGPGGLWQAIAELGTDGDDVRHHLLRAEAQVDGQALQSTVVDVVVDPHAAVLLTVTMSQPGNRDVTFAATDGVARFPFTFVPGQPVVVTARFSGPVTEVRAQVGDRFGTMQPVAGQPETWQASLALGPQELGDLTVTFTPVVAERPILPVPPMPTESLVDPDEVTRQEPEIDGDSVSQTFTAPVPALGPQARVTGRLVITKLPDYRPSAADLALAKATGVYAYEVMLDATRRADVRRTGNLTVSASAVVDLATLHAGPETPLTQALGALNFYTGPARAVFFWSYQLATYGDAFWSAGSEFVIDGKYAAITKLQQMAMACADPARSNYYQGRVELLLQKAGAMDAFAASYAMAGLLLGPETFGVGTVVIWGVGWGIGKAMEYRLNSDIDTLKGEMFRDPECRPDPADPTTPRNPGLDPKDWSDPTAEPTWIHDPSGIVYEGTADRPVAGVTATLLTAPTADGPWTVWSAEPFGQTNPLVTDEVGHYGWDVPEGWWKVVYSKDGYVTAESRVLRVLPPHTDVDVNLVQASLATVDRIDVDGDGLTVTFTQPMRVNQVLGGLLAVATSDGTPMAGQWAAVSPQPAPVSHPHAGEPLATGFRFTGERHHGEVVVTVDPSTQDHVGRAILDGVRQAVAVAWTGPDAAAPQVQVTGVSASAIYRLGAVPVAGCLTTDQGSGVAVEAQLTITGGNAAGVGQFTATCAGAVDRAGNAAEPVSVTYTVGYVFTGFDAPVSNGGGLNQAKAGQNIPIKWRLTTATGAPVTSVAGARLTVTPIDCASGRPTGPAEVYASGSAVQPNGDGKFHVNWKTDKAYAGSCRVLAVDLGEGAAITHTASFQFK